MTTLSRRTFFRGAAAAGLVGATSPMITPALAVPNSMPVLDAVGDDATLNDAAFSTFLSQAYNARAGRIPWAPGAYRITQPINATGIALIGDGRGSRIRLVNNTPLPSISCWAGTPYGETARLENFQILAPLRADGSPQTGDGNYGVSTHNQGRIVIRGVTIDSHRIGIYLHDSWGFIIEQCFLTNMLGAAILTGDKSAHNAMIRENGIYTCGVPLSQLSVVINRAGALNFIGNDIEGGWGAAHFDTVTEGTFSGNWSERMAAYNFLMTNCGQKWIDQLPLNTINGGPW